MTGWRHPARDPLQATEDTTRMSDIHSLFAVPFGFARLPDCARLNDELRTLFLQREAEGQRFANPNPYTLRNPALFESHFDLFKWPERCVQQLRRFCLAEMTRTAEQLAGYDHGTLDRYRLNVDAWFHVTRAGGTFGVHNHPMASWSGVYCVSAGTEHPDYAESGQLTFVNPFIMSSMFLDPANAHMKAPFSHNSMRFKLQPGQLILFPSWVLHEVQTFHGDGERITVAFNAWFTEQGGST